jgi:hypothetical protein
MDNRSTDQLRIQRKQRDCSENRRRTASDANVIERFLALLIGRGQEAFSFRMRSERLNGLVGQDRVLAAFCAALLCPVVESRIELNLRLGSRTIACVQN